MSVPTMTKNGSRDEVVAEIKTFFREATERGIPRRRLIDALAAIVGVSFVTVYRWLDEEPSIPQPHLIPLIRNALQTMRKIYGL